MTQPPGTPLPFGPASQPAPSTGIGSVGQQGAQAVAAANRILAPLFPNGGRPSAANEVQFNTLSSPPPLTTMIFSPQVRVIIGTSIGVDGVGTQYDVSSDIVRCSLSRSESSAATFFLTLSNKGLRYTPPSGNPLFRRMDRIIVYMKRKDDRQVFSGYLDSVPYRQLYPGTVDFKATCTIKRIMHTWWNPGLPANVGLTDQMASESVTGGGGDSGLTGMLQRVLRDVGGWAPEDIVVQKFPNTFFALMKAEVAKLAPTNREAVDAFDTLILGEDHSPGPKSFAGHNSNAGPPGPTVPLAGAAGSIPYIADIVTACDNKSLGPRVSDNTYSTSVAKAGATGQGSMDQSSSQAFDQIRQNAQDQAQANRNSDAAIIGVAVALTVSGGGLTIRNLSNPAVPNSERYVGDGPGLNGTCCGIFQLPNLSEWGDVSQRMNPQQAAAMFFSKMVNLVPDWRNQDPAQVAQITQQSSGSAYSGAMALATAQVQAYRTAVGGATSTTSGATGTTIPGTLAPLGQAGTPSLSPSLVTGTPITSPTPAGLGGADPLAQGRPVPDSEGALNFMLSKCGNTPYKWGGKGPNSYDCSGLVKAAFSSIGVATGDGTGGIRAGVREIPKSIAGRGDIYEPHEDHVGMLLGPPVPGSLFVSAATDREPLARQIRVQAWYPGGNEWYGRACLNGGVNPSSAYNAALAVNNPGAVPPGALDQQGYGTNAGSSGSSDEGIARNLFSYIFRAEDFSGDISQFQGGEKAFLNGAPLIEMITSICAASLRKFQSSPNGMFYAYYPDWWGVDGKNAVFKVRDIELKDATINFSDDSLTTHVYVEGDHSGIGLGAEVRGWLDTAGVATVENEFLYARLSQVSPGGNEFLAGKQITQRFGVRPLKQQFAFAGSSELEFLLACNLFMEKWAQQYQTTISLTFMPELYPGMRIELEGHNLTVYVTAVEHTCDYEAGFSTSATILAPTTPDLLNKIRSVLVPASDGQTQSGANIVFTAPFDQGEG